MTSKELTEVDITLGDILETLKELGEKAPPLIQRIADAIEACNITIDDCYNTPYDEECLEAKGKLLAFKEVLQFMMDNDIVA